MNDSHSFIRNLKVHGVSPQYQLREVGGGEAGVDPDPHTASAKYSSSRLILIAKPPTKCPDICTVLQSTLFLLTPIVNEGTFRFKGTVSR